MAAILSINAAGQSGKKINKNIYGHFSEHLGRCIYGGVYVGENSDIPNVNGMRTDVVQALKKIDPQFPKLDPEVQKQLETFKKLIAQVDVKELAEIQTTLSEKASKENKEN